jgi:hypothetical protein
MQRNRIGCLMYDRDGRVLVVLVSEGAEGY